LWIVPEDAKGKYRPAHPEARLLIKPVAVKSVLTKSKIEGIDYTVNPYYGCQHGCRYCYSAWMTGKRFPGLSWGEYVFPKVNAPQVIARELDRVNLGLVEIGSSTDPYQPVESTFRLTRRCLEVLVRRRDFSVSVLTKSPLVLRDIDLLKAGDVEVGFSISGLGGPILKALEPRAPSPHLRLKALRKLVREGVRTFAFVSPILPGVTDVQAQELFRELSEVKPDRVLVDRLRFRPGVWSMIRRALSNFPEALRLYSDLRKNDQWFDYVKMLLSSEAGKWGIELEFVY